MSEEPEELKVIEMETCDAPRVNTGKHSLVGYKNGKPSEEEPFDEIRLVENVGSEFELKYKGKL